ncbi:MAG: TIGR00725 family protein [Chloroflexi bacterium]|nr:TIGR00725 family protein [Chloroflexota bacterium]
MPPAGDQKYVAVIGGSDCTSEEARLAEEVGRELARQGAVLICGGLGGIMEAACKGASAGGGLTIGVLPGASRKQANPYIQIPIVTGLGEARNIIIIKTAQAVIAINGGFGTLSEIGFALRSGVPVVGLKTWSLYRNDRLDSSIVVVDTARDAVSVALDLIS